jgi:hypothetical protein
VEGQRLTRNGHARLKRLKKPVSNSRPRSLEISIRYNPFAAVGITAGISFIYAMIRG